MAKTAFTAIRRVCEMTEVFGRLRLRHSPSAPRSGASTIDAVHRGAAPARRALIGHFVVLALFEAGGFVLAPTAFWLAIVRWLHAIPLT